MSQADPACHREPPGSQRRLVWLASRLLHTWMQSEIFWKADSGAPGLLSWVPKGVCLSPTAHTPSDSIRWMRPDWAFFLLKCCSDKGVISGGLGAPLQRNGEKPHQNLQKVKGGVLRLQLRLYSVQHSWQFVFLLQKAISRPPDLLDYDCQFQKSVSKPRMLVWHNDGGSSQRVGLLKVACVERRAARRGAAPKMHWTVRRFETWLTEVLIVEVSRRRVVCPGLCDGRGSLRNSRGEGGC